MNLLYRQNNTHGQMDAIGRVEYAESLVALLSFGRKLAATYPTCYPSIPFYLYSTDIFIIGMNVS